jgi:hypothetical protein
VSGSLRITGPWSVQTNSTSLLANRTVSSVSFFFKLNGTGNSGWFFAHGAFFPIFATSGSTLESRLGTLDYALTPHVGTVYHVAIVWNGAGTSTAYLNGVPVQTRTDSGISTNSASQNLQLGFFTQGGAAVDCQIADLAVWNAYALNRAEVDALRDKTATPAQTGSGSFAWWTLNGTLNGTPLYTDAGFQDSGNAGVNFTSFATGSAPNAVYAGPLVFSPPTTVVPYVMKCGSELAFFTTSASDGSLSNITAVLQDPTIQVQFGGVGARHTVPNWGPLWAPDTHTLPFAAYQIACGPVAEIVVQNGGSNYSSSPTASCSGGGGSGCTLGTPVVSPGVTSVTVGSGGVGYTSIPTVLFFGGNGYGAMATARIAGGVVVGVDVFEPGYGYTVPPTMGINRGGASVDATCSPVLSNAIRSIPVTAAGSGYTGPPTITITDGTGSGAVAVAQLGGVGPTDIVTYTGVADGWLTAESGIAPAVPSQYVPSNVVTNYAGRLEPGVGGYSDFDLPAVERTLKVGYNVGMAHSNYSSLYNAHVNWLKRALITVGVHNVVSITPDSKPLTLSGPASFDICDPTTNFMDLSNYPVADGVWTFVADDTDSTKPMVVGLGVYHGGATITTNYTPGTTTTGLKALTLTAGGSGYTEAPKVTISGGGGSGASAYSQIGGTGQVIGVYVRAVGSGYSTTPTVAFSGGGGSGATASCTTGSVISGSVWQFTVARTSSVDADLGINVAFSNPAQVGTFPYTLTDERLFSPATSAFWAPAIPPRDFPGGADQSLITWLTTPSGKGPPILRYIEPLLGTAGIPTNIVDAIDLKDPNDWSWDQRAPLTGADLTANPTGARHFNIVAIRTYGISTAGYPGGWGMSWSSPDVYLPEAGTIGTPVGGWPGAYGGGVAGPFKISPASVGYVNFLGGQWFAFEAVTDVPHNLKTGQKINYVSGSTTFPISTNNSGGTTTAHIDTAGVEINLPVYVTGPTTFAASFFWGAPLDGTGQPGSICHVVGTNAVSYVFKVYVPDGATIPYEVAAQITGSFPETDHYINIPVAATDACCAAIARRTRDNLPVGRKVYVEFGDENWNLGFPMGFFTNAMGNLGVWTNGTNVGSVEAYTARIAQHQQTFVNTFNAMDVNGNTNRGGEIVRFFAGLFVFPAATCQVIVNYANAHSIPIDVYAGADYRDVLDQGYPNPCMKLAAAALASGWPTSRAYGTTMPWTRAMYIDLYRHVLKYDSTVNGPTSFFAQNLAALATYTAGPTPLLVGYEGGLETLVPGGIETGPDPEGFYLTAQLAHDIYYAPEIYDAEMAHYQSAQAGGMSWITLYRLAGPFFGQYSWSQAVWSSAIWSGQPVGKGDGS